MYRFFAMVLVKLFQKMSAFIEWAVLCGLRPGGEAWRDYISGASVNFDGIRRY